MRRLPALALGLVLLLAAAACGTQDPAASPSPSPAPSPTDAAPSPTATQPSPASPSPSPTETQRSPASPSPTETQPSPDASEGTDEVTVYLVRSHDSGLWVEPAQVALATPTVAVARAAIEAMLAGEGAADPALQTLAPTGTELLDISAGDDGVLTVDLSGEVRDGSQAGGAGEDAFAQQLAHTGGQFDSVDAVRLLVEGEAVTDLWGHVDWSQPIEPDPFAVSPVLFTSHEWGEQVSTGEVTVGGEACTFEATVELRLVAPDGQLVQEAFTTAASACPEGGPWEHTFTLPEPGTWTIEAAEPDPSAGEGRPPLITTLDLEAS